MIMDISGAQLTSAAISAFNAQLQVASQQTQQAATPAPAQPSTEVTLSRDSLESASHNGGVASAQNPPNNPAVTAPGSSNQTTPEARSSQDGTTEGGAVSTREVESRRQANQAAQSQTTTSTYTASVAAQSYYSVSNF